MTIAVIGRGLIGSAAARHLAEAGHEVLLIGPEEPADKRAHRGVFGSHYDEGRITRGLDPYAFWSRVSRASIARYREIEAKSGVPFYTEVGVLMAGPVAGRFIQDVDQVRREAGIEATRYEGAALAERFPYFAFPPDTMALHEPKGAGHISPRRLVRAQTIAAERAGARLMAATVSAVEEAGDGVRIVTDQGEVRVERALVAAGGFTNMMLAEPLPLSVYARTVALFEVDEAEAARLRTMPSMIFLKPNGEDPYMLPPIRYPDGKFYLKLGGDPEDVPLKDAEAIGAWFRTGGSAQVEAALEAHMRARMPDLNIRAVRRDACVTTYTPNNRPIIDRISDRVAVAVAGCGRAAKNSDELGRMGGAALFGETDPECSLAAAGV